MKISTKLKLVDYVDSLSMMPKRSKMFLCAPIYIAIYVWWVVDGGFGWRSGGGGVDQLVLVA